MKWLSSLFFSCLMLPLLVNAQTNNKVANDFSGYHAYWSDDATNFRVQFYEEGELKWNSVLLPKSNFQEDLEAIEIPVYQSAEVDPVYNEEGDLQLAISKYTGTISYPNEAKDYDVEGMVFVRFIVNPDGKVTNVECIQSAHPILDNASVKHFENMPQWKSPGMVNGKKVSVQFTTPVVFRLM